MEKVLVGGKRCFLFHPFSWSSSSSISSSSGRGSSRRPHLEHRVPSKKRFPHLTSPLSPLSWNRLYGLHTWHSSCVGGTAFTASPTVHMAPKAQQQRSPRSIFTYTSSLQLSAAVLPEKCNHKCWWLVIWWPKSSQGRTRERISHKAAHFSPLLYL